MKKDYLKYLAALLLFGSNGIVASRIALNSYEIVLLRTFIGSIFLAVLFFFGHRRLTFFHYKKDAGFLALSGAAMGASWMFLYEAYAQVGVSIATLLYYCGPVIVMVLSPALFGEKLTAGKIAGFLAVLCGIFFINSSGAVSGGNAWGYLCGLLSAATYAVMVMANKKAVHITGMENAMLQMFVSFAVVAAYVGLRQGFALAIPPESWPAILVLGMVNTGIGCYLYFSSIGHLPMQTVAICGYLEPLSAVVFSALILHEILSPAQLFGAVLILGGALYGELYHR